VFLPYLLPVPNRIQSEIIGCFVTPDDQNN
jgi:hypothetical protein